MAPRRTACSREPLDVPAELWSIILSDFDNVALALAEQISHAAFHSSRMRTLLKISPNPRAQQSPAVVAAALARYAMLEELVVVEGKGSKKVAGFLSVALGGINRTAIRRLTISAGTPVGPAIPFRDVIGTWSNLEALILSNASAVTDASVHELLLKLPFTTALRELRLDGCKVGDGCLAWIGLATSLTVLDLSYTDVSERGLGLLYAPNAVTAYASVRELHLNGCRRLRSLPEHICTPYLRTLDVSDGGHHADGSFYATPMLLSASSLDVLMHHNAHPVILDAVDERIQSAGPLAAQLERLTICGSARALPAARLRRLFRMCTSSLTYLSVGGDSRSIGLLSLTLTPTPTHTLTLTLRSAPLRIRSATVPQVLSR